MIISKRKNNKDCVKKQKYFNTLEVVIIMVITCLLSMFLGSIITFFTTKNDKEICESISKDKYIEEFSNSYNNILSNYYNEIDKKELVDAAIEGMITYLNDPYATFLNTEESIEFSKNVEGEYYGIGIEIINVNDNFYISKVLKDSSAYEEKLEINDQILEINNNNINDMNINDIYTLIKNNSKITLKVLSKNKERTVILTKKQVEIPSVSSKLENINNKKVGIITINIFAANTTKQFKKALTDLEKENIDSLVIDVRDNNGGYLSSATEIASMFLQKNKIIYQLTSKGIKEPVLDQTKEKRTYKIVVLINENTASASEVLTLALKESYNATIVGVKSYGKGTIQKAYNLNDGSMFKYTIQEWLSPSGKSIEGKGIEPDITETDKNNQLLKAIEASIE